MKTILYTLALYGVFHLLLILTGALMGTLEIA